MTEVVSADAFDKCVRKLKDKQGKLRIGERIDRLAHGNPGDVRDLSVAVSPNCD
jgi:putative component of toxin-antitoxin plasmid stabilization module